MAGWLSLSPASDQVRFSGRLVCWARQSPGAWPRACRRAGRPRRASRSRTACSGAPRPWRPAGSASHTGLRPDDDTTQRRLRLTVIERQPRIDKGTCQPRPKREHVADRSTERTQWQRPGLGPVRPVPQLAEDPARAFSSHAVSRRQRVGTSRLRSIAVKRGIAQGGQRSQPKLLAGRR